MRSCSAVRCASWSAAGGSRREWLRHRRGRAAPSTRCRSPQRRSRRSSCSSSSPRAMPDRGTPAREAEKAARGAPSAPFGTGRLRRLFGLDRSAPPPAQTRKGQPLHPFTLPNLVGYVRLAAIPVFLVLAFNSGDGRSAPAAILFLLIAAGDYLDGFLARVTGQYSRMGALLDPVVDRLTILSGAVVCWHFELLPRWALALVAVREIITVALAQYGLRKDVDLEVNWLGRAAVWPVMGAIFLAMVMDNWIPTTMLNLGMVTGILATALYLRMGLRDLRAPQAGAHSS